MNKWVGVESILYGGSSLKQAALIFDRIAVLGLNFALALVADPRAREALRLRPRPGFNDLLWLIEQGIIFDLETVLPDDAVIENAESKKYQDLRQEQLERMNSVFHDMPDDRNDVFARLAQHTKHADKADEYLLRSLCVELRELCKMEAYPIMPDGISPFEQSNAPKSDVVQIVLHALPMPDELTPWEHILEYRSDPNSQAKFLDLRNWMNEIARGALTPIEVEQKLEYLLSQYQRHMAIHKMKANTEAIETIIVSNADFIKNLVTFNWGKIAKGLFALKHRRIALLEGELTSLGNEVAYVIKARDTFTSI